MTMVGSRSDGVNRPVRLSLVRGLKMLFLERVTMTRGGFGFLEVESKVGVEDVVGLWALECGVVGVASLTVIEEKGRVQ